MKSNEELINSSIILIESMVEDGLNYKEIAERIGMSRKTFERYKAKNLELKKAIAKGKSKRNQKLIEASSWGEFRKGKSDLEVCKILLKEYIKVKTFKWICKKYKTSYRYIDHFLNRNSKIFDDEAIDLYEIMETIRYSNVQFSSAKKRSIERETDKSKPTQFDKLDYFPMRINYTSFLNEIAKVSTGDTTTQQWIDEAKKRGIKVIG